MSTRCNVIIKQADKAVQLYHHHDGYPSGVGVDLAGYFEQISSDDKLLNDLLKSPTKLGKWLANCEDRDDEYRYEGANINLHGDIEYLYIIDMDKQDITCYEVNGWDRDLYDIIDKNKDVGTLIYIASMWDSVDDVNKYIEEYEDSLWDD